MENQAKKLYEVANKAYEESNKRFRSARNVDERNRALADMEGADIVRQRAKRMTRDNQ